MSFTNFCDQNFLREAKTFVTNFQKLLLRDEVVLSKLRPKTFHKWFEIQNNDGTHATFAKFSRSFRKFFEVFVGSETCLDLFGPSRMRSDTFGCARKHSEAFGRFPIFLKIFDMFWCFFALLPIFFSRIMSFGGARKFWASLADSSSKTSACSSFIFSLRALANG